MASATIEDRIRSLGITLPPAPKALGLYQPGVISGSLLFLSGTLPLRENGELVTGKVGKDLDLEAGKEAARLATINALAAARAVLGGSLERVIRIVRASGFVNCLPDFTDHPQVVNGASELLGDIFGESGRHARLALGAGSLPRNAAFELELILEVAPSP